MKIKYRQPIIKTDGTFIGFHKWGIDDEGRFMPPVNDLGYKDTRAESQIWIGLEDKNKVEIYEGDILRNESIGINYLIKYIAEECKFEGKGKMSFMLPINFNEHSIVGNIFENPELLK